MIPIPFLTFGTGSPYVEKYDGKPKIHLPQIISEKKFETKKQKRNNGSTSVCCFGSYCLYEGTRQSSSKCFARAECRRTVLVDVRSRRLFCVTRYLPHGSLRVFNTISHAKSVPMNNDSFQFFVVGSYRYRQRFLTTDSAKHRWNPVLRHEQGVLFSKLMLLVA